MPTAQSQPPCVQPAGRGQLVRCGRNHHFGTVSIPVSVFNSARLPLRPSKVQWHGSHFFYFSGQPFSVSAFVCGVSPAQPSQESGCYLLGPNDLSFPAPVSLAQCAPVSLAQCAFSRYMMPWSHGHTRLQVQPHQLTQTQGAVHAVLPQWGHWLLQPE